MPEKNKIHKDYFTVSDIDSLKRCLQLLNESEYVALDTETTGLNVRKDKIIGASFSTSPGVSFYIPTLKYIKETDSFDDFYIGSNKSSVILKIIFESLIRDKKNIITHNGSFDTSIIYYQYDIDLLPQLYCETTLATHTIIEEGAISFGKPFALKSIAQMLKSEIKLDDEDEANQEQIDLKQSIIANGGKVNASNFELYKADFDLLSKYACADTDLTLRIAYYFLFRIRKEGMWDFFFKEEVMPVYKEVTVPMERRGVLLDIELIKRTGEEITKHIDDYRSKVIDELITIDTVKDWIYDQAKSKFPFKNKGTFAKTLAEEYNIPLPKTKSGNYSFSKKNIDELEESSYKKFLQDPDNAPRDIHSDLLKISLKLWKEFNKGNYINISSKKHLAEIMFNCLGFEPMSVTDKGTPQVNDSTIEDIAKKNTWANSLRIYNRLVKIKSTYIDRLLEESDEGIFYPYFKQHGTVTGRYGSNLQQLPKPKEEGEDDPIVLEFNNRIRAFFISRPNYKFIDSDYESLEPHIFASISDDINLQEIFNQGHDFYSTVAIRTERLEGVSPDKKADNYLKKVNAPKRQRAKAYALGIAYGMSGYALAKSLDIPVKEGEALREAYLDGFPGVSNWIRESREEFERTGVIKNSLGRARHLTEGKRVFDRYGADLLDYNFRRDLSKKLDEDKVLNMYRDLKNSYNAALNFQIQSLAASIVNRAALIINRAFKKLGWDGEVIAQIHDQLIIEVHESIADKAMPLVQYIMENNVKLPGVTLKSPPEISNNFLEGH